MKQNKANVERGEIKWVTLAPYNICILASIRKNQIWGCSRNSFYCYYCLCVCERWVLYICNKKMSEFAVWFILCFYQDRQV